MLSVARIRASSFAYDGLLQLPSSPEPSIKREPTWAERGFQFIPIRAAHLDFLAYIYGGEPLALAEVEGYAMVDKECLLLGLCVVHHEPCGTNTLHAHFGRWLRIYPKDILRGIKVMSDDLRRRGVTELHAIADESVEGSDTLLKWVGATATGQRGETGPIYRLDLNESKI